MRNGAGPKFRSTVSIYLAVVIGALLLTSTIWRIRLGNRVEGQLEKIKAAELPTSGAELNEWIPTVPDSENGARVMQEAIELWRTFPDRRSNELYFTISRTNQWSPKERKLAEEHLALNTASLAKAREALAYQRFHYPIDYSSGPLTPLPHLSPLKDLARLMSYQALLDAEAGRSNEWPDEIALILKTGESLDMEPDGISYLCGNGIFSLACAAAERCLGSGDLSDENAKMLQAAFTKCARTNGLARALIGERAENIPIFRLSLKEAFTFDQNGQSEKSLSFSGKGNVVSEITGIFDRDLSFYIETMDEAISLAGKPPPAWLEATNRFASTVDTANDHYYIVSAMLLPVLDDYFVNQTRVTAKLRLAESAMALERFRHARGHCPSSLDELVPAFINAVPSDPFDGKPLRYRQTPKGCMVYSIGLTGHDDGGRERPKNTKLVDPNQYDVTFVVER